MHTQYTCTSSFCASVTTTKPPSSMWLKSDNTCKFCSVSQEKHDFRSSSLTSFRFSLVQVLIVTHKSWSGQEELDKDICHGQDRV